MDTTTDLMMLDITALYASLITDVPSIPTTARIHILFCCLVCVLGNDNESGGESLENCLDKSMVAFICAH